MTHLNSKGIFLVNTVISMKLNMANLIPTENLLDMNYDYFYNLSLTASKKEYNALLKRIFAQSAKRIQRKKKIKIGFVICRAEEWCGDELYNLFANNKRFEVAIFVCYEFAVKKLRKNKFFKEIYLQNVEQFKRRGLNVVAVKDEKVAVPVQDVIISLTPCFDKLPEAFSSENLTPKTLIVNIPPKPSLASYGKNYYGLLIFRIVWKIFFASKADLEIYDKEIPKGMIQKVSVGCPKMDFFFKKDINLNFDWKMARPDAKKIIYAPHWSINESGGRVSFQSNCQFIYEFAKIHPEISWVVKPYQKIFATVKDNAFSSGEEYAMYLRKWDELPNAQVYTGAYYQEIFVTSDGMIHDGDSFIAEYQCTLKPIIFLSRKSEKFNDIGKEILKTSYSVDEKDLKGIAATIQQIFIEGKDDKAAQRKKVFDKYLNYSKLNGALTSKSIYKKIANEFKPE